MKALCWHEARHSVRQRAGPRDRRRSRRNYQGDEVGRQKKDDPADVAKTGLEAMMKGEGDVVSGIKNKLQVAAASVTPSSILAEQHRKKAEPQSTVK